MLHLVFEVVHRGAGPAAGVIDPCSMFMACGLICFLSYICGCQGPEVPLSRVTSTTLVANKGKTCTNLLKVPNLGGANKPYKVSPENCYEEENHAFLRREVAREVY